MIFFTLQKKLRELVTSKCTLLWLEGTKHERVMKIKLSGNKILLTLANDTTRVIAFERYATTSVGLQFWYQGKAGVLYKWEQVTSPEHYGQLPKDDFLPDDDPTPPDIAA
ncbi:hypothetical protein [Silvanigrella aquatica]|uniref:Uncharacterized protein n=1 Tax=Silvanigrella aquatica TaxID=1915309 RepID=A0A1L4D2X1_9BACT|nr:hypothetical protein [Silvanigrella aquatica]APJ04537.1 hypothetical protein AXG55_11725 [Silvanigrella aquatica]